MVVQNVVQLIEQAFFDKAVKELHLLRAMFHRVTDDVFDHVFRKFHIRTQIRKCDFRLNHPELRCVTRRIGVFSTEGRTESVDITESRTEGFAVQLTRYRQVCFFTEEVF
ncbi:hypothetical protein D3C87_1659980 [compost metagenome]